MTSFPSPVYTPPGGGNFQKKLGEGVWHASWNSYLITDQSLWFSLPYFRLDQKFDTLFQTCLIVSSVGETNVKGNVYTLLVKSN